MRPADLTLQLLDQGQPATLRVQGRSMWPTLAVGDEVRVEQRSTYAVGDLVAFDDGRESLVVHRLIAERAGQVRTRGDYMFQADPWISKADIRGAVRGISRRKISRLLHLLRLNNPLRKLTLWIRERRHLARTWTIPGVLTYIVYRTILRPFLPSARVLISAEAETRLVNLPEGYTIQEGALSALELNLESSGLILPVNGHEHTVGAVIYFESHEVAAVWTTLVEPGFAFIHDSYVVAEHRGQGLAKIMTAWVFTHWTPGTTILGAIQLHNAASRAKNSAAGFRDIGYQLELWSWLHRRTLEWVWAKKGESALVAAWQRTNQIRVRR